MGQHHRRLGIALQERHGIFEGLVENLIGVVESARTELVATAAWSPERMDEVLERMRAWSRTPGATIWYALPYVHAAR